MRTRIQIYNPTENGVKVPRIFINLREREVRRLVDDMRLYGLTSVTVTPVFVGLVLNPIYSYKATEAAVPAELVSVRARIVKDIGDRLLLHGIFNLEIEPTQAELDETLKGWQQLEAGDEAFKGIKLNIDTDPTNPETKDGKDTEAKGS